jgi:hypothetical protein
MPGIGKCPKCQQTVDRCDLDPMIIGDRESGAYFHGGLVCCPHCKTILGVSIDSPNLARYIAKLVAEEIEEKLANQRLQVNRTPTIAGDNCQYPKQRGEWEIHGLVPSRRLRCNGRAGRETGRRLRNSSCHNLNHQKVQSNRHHCRDQSHLQRTTGCGLL